MSTLRFFVDEDPGRSVASTLSWALYDDAARLYEQGHSAPNTWPRADRIEGIIAAPLTRLMRVAVPKMSAAQLPAALSYALEDQLAGDPATHHVAPGARAEDGSLLVAVVNKALIADLLHLLGKHTLPIERLVAEPCLPARTAGEWVWVDAERGGFVVTGDGSSLAVDHADDNVPAALTLALEAYAESGGAAPSLRWYASAERRVSLNKVLESYGIHAIAEAPWNWRSATPQAMLASIDLLRGEFQALSPKSIPGCRRALWVVAAALLIHVVATVASWGTLQWRAHSARTAMDSIYATAFPSAPSAGDIQADFARQYAQAAHARGGLAPNDALPLLARVAPVLQQVGLPDWRTLVYSASSLTLEMPRIAPGQVLQLQRALLAVGVNCAVADFDGGSRIRLQEAL